MRVIFQHFKLCTEKRFFLRHECDATKEIDATKRKLYTTTASRWIFGLNTAIASVQWIVCIPCIHRDLNIFFYSRMLASTSRLHSVNELRTKSYALNAFTHERTHGYRETENRVCVCNCTEAYVKNDMVYGTVVAVRTTNIIIGCVSRSQIHDKCIQKQKKSTTRRYDDQTTWMYAQSVAFSYAGFHHAPHSV